MINEQRLNECTDRLSDVCEEYPEEFFSCALNIITYLINQNSSDVSEKLGVNSDKDFILQSFLCGLQNNETLYLAITDPLIMVEFGIRAGMVDATPHELTALCFKKESFIKSLEQLES